MAACFFCGTSLDPGQRLTRESTCPGCQRDLHACVQCRHYDPHAHNKCREPQAEWVTDRERRNFCEYFVLNPAGRGSGQADRATKARSQLDRLFKPKGNDPE
jgi:hypothetical protein